MAYMFVMGPCYTCGALMTYNPDHVPSIPIDPATGQSAPGGVRQAVCAACVRRANPERVKNGLPEIVVHPDAYEPQEVN
jgi:hypothetical protein